jgi:hypothetical protein
MNIFPDSFLSSRREMIGNFLYLGNTMRTAAASKRMSMALLRTIITKATASTFCMKPMRVEMW